MKNVVVVGSQWGDEGKGKIVDWLSEQADVVVRFQGGHNAGHTLVIDGKVYKLKLLPSGIVRSDKISVIGNGVVVDPWALLDEIEQITKQGVTVNEKNLILAETASLIMPFHREMDEIREDSAGKGKIGTTRRGIGPAYEDKVARRGLRVGDLLDEELFAVKLKEVVDYHNFSLQNYYKQPAVDYKKTLEQALSQAKIVKSMIIDVADELHKQMANDENILFEGAQGALLDIDQGTYPFVTSSNTTSGGAVTGSGVGVRDIDYVLGIVKAYTTRVGGGPFPTELDYDVNTDEGDPIGRELCSRGHEFGATTGRQRRCGWLDLVILNRSFKLNSVSGICLTKLDVMDELDLIKICVAYEIDGHTSTIPPFSAEGYSAATPIYIEMPGWKSSTIGTHSFDELPQEAKNYIRKIEELSQIPVDILSTGPDRDETLILNNPFD